jgi:peptidoglycan/LPS O-acetylase OafA/YrhL
MLNREKMISFVIFGLFVFSPLIPSWQSHITGQWYTFYLFWLFLIGACAQFRWFNRERLNQD